VHDGYTVRSFLGNPTREKERLDDRLMSIKVPTLVVWGKQDILLPIASGSGTPRESRARSWSALTSAGTSAIEKTEEFLAAVVAFLAAARLRCTDRGAAKATESSCAQDFESARSTESAPEPLIMMAKATRAQEDGTRCFSF